MEAFEEMKAYVRFGPEDRARLQAFWPTVAPQVQAVTDAFYDRILEFDGARTVFSGPEQVARLKRTLEVWLQELLNGPYDTAYYERRRRIGFKHVEVGLPHRYMYTAMHGITEHLCAIAQGSLPAAKAVQVCASVRRVAMLDLAIMNGTYMGLHERGRMEDLAVLLVAHLPSAAFVLGPEGDVVASTEAARQLCGADPHGRSCLDALPQALVDAAELDRHLRHVHEAPVELVRVDVDLDGSDRSFRVSIAPIGHDAFSTLVVLDEITASLREEAARRRTEALAQIGSMSAAVAHELRNPLAGISGAIQVIAGTLDDDDRRRPVMSKVRDQIGRLDRMVRDLLAFSRPPEARLACVALHEVADVVVDLVRRDHDGVSLSREGTGSALADADLVHRILLNLVQNAVGATGGTGHVVVRVDEDVVDVCDDGPGIDPDNAARVFEPFFTTKMTGTGLGLAICRNAAEAMDARLDLVPSTLGGAGFRLSFPPRGSLGPAA
ncbi:MAG: hypothetical protein H6733_12595 [Alphaproteobacteria bacterium]|nr:hypothetical protein [Alphaproteobacteria bacterium]